MSKIVKLEHLDPLKTEKIIFGGTFDPIHSGHISVIKALREKFSTILVAPTGQNPWKAVKASDFELRRAMIRLVLKEEKLLDCIRVFDRPYVFSEELVKFLRQGKNPQTIYWAVGCDSADTVENWKNWDLLDLTVVIVPVVIDIHATAIRAGQKPVHPALKEFVLEHGLYKGRTT